MIPLGGVPRGSVGVVWDMTYHRLPASLTSLGLIVCALSACQPALRPITEPSPDPSRDASPATSRGAPRTALAASRARPTTDLVTDDVVAQAAAALLGDASPLDGVSDDASDAEPTWDIDVRSYETHDRVEHYIRAFTGNARDRMSERISRGTKYEPMIRNKMRENGLPEDLFYLALIESGYDPHAYSSAAAVGMWQFMTATGKDVGLRIDWWIDERRDPARSTDAAISFLKSLQQQFGSLYLAAAAYNGGPGRVARGLSQFASAIGDVEGDDRFFALAEQDYLHSETKNYVPQLIAAALVAKEPIKYGLNVERQTPFAYDSVLVEAGSSLGALARASAVPLDSLIELNPAVLRGAAPPDRALWVRVPVGMDSLMSAAFATLEPGKRSAWNEVEPRKGETMTGLAKRHDMTLRELEWYNPSVRIGRGGAVASGQMVRVPTRETILMARVVPNPAVERYGGSVARAHVVRSGESLGAISQRHGVPVSRLKSMNGLRTDRIRIGQRLTIGGSVAASASKTPVAKNTTHTVRPGESLSVIAERYDTTVSRIKLLNKLRSDRIKAGQKLMVRRAT